MLDVQISPADAECAYRQRGGHSIVALFPSCSVPCDRVDEIDARKFLAATWPRDAANERPLAIRHSCPRAERDGHDHSLHTNHRTAKIVSLFFAFSPIFVINDFVSLLDRVVLTVRIEAMLPFSVLPTNSVRLDDGAAVAFETVFRWNKWLARPWPGVKEHRESFWRLHFEQLCGLSSYHLRDFFFAKLALERAGRLFPLDADEQCALAECYENAKGRCRTQQTIESHRPTQLAGRVDANQLRRGVAGSVYGAVTLDKLAEVVAEEGVGLFRR